MSVDLDLDESLNGETAPAGAVVPPTMAKAEVDVNEAIDDDDRLPERAIANDDGSVTLPLLYPKSLNVKKPSGDVKEERYASLTFHRLTGADQRAIAAASDSTAAVVAFARSTRLMQAKMNVLYDKMDAADIADGSSVLNSFLPRGRKTGRRD